MTIYIISSNKSIHSIEALQYSINKYWTPNPNVVVLSYDQPTNFQLADNVRVDSIEGIIMLTRILFNILVKLKNHILYFLVMTFH